MAARALANAGLVHAYGHCSVRHSAEQFWVSPSKPLSCVTADDSNLRVPVSGELPEGVLGEVRIHQQIYRRRTDVGAICRIMSPAVMTLSSQSLVPVPRHGLGAYFDELPLWPDPALLRDDDKAAALAELLGSCLAVVMRGNGAVIAASTLQQAVTYSWFLEDAARLELAVRSAGFGEQAQRLSDDEVSARQVVTPDVFDRMWQHLTRDDPESGNAINISKN